MAFKFQPLTRQAMARYGLAEDAIAYLEGLEEQSRKFGRSMRPVSQSALLMKQARQAKKLEAQSRKRRMMGDR